MTVRTRIAPSPTGDPHVGTAYIALFNYCFAKQHGGQFLLRIEDTDQARSTPESERAILDALRWTGLSWDEGPDVGGPHGPYRQSERSAIYAEHVQRLLDSGHAFRCFCTPERLGELRKEQLAAGSNFLGYDGKCLELTPEQVQAKLDAGEPYVVRLKVAREGTCVIKDRLRGDIEIAWDTVDMQVLMKSDGMPTYHLANVVDDHLMGITHVIRGEEWISSAPKHVLLYEAFGWEVPQFIHMPLLRNPDKSKLSKRKNPTSILYYQRAGVLPEGLLNYLGMMGWSMPDGSERFDLAQMVASFDIDRVSLGGPVFDQVKLDALNGRWLREAMTPEQLGQRLQDWALNLASLTQIAPLVQPRLNRLSDFVPMAGFFFMDVPQLQAESFAPCKADPEEIKRWMQLALWRLESVRVWEREVIEAQLKGLADALELKYRDFNKPLFVALTGSAVSTPLFDSMAILGADLTRVRLRAAIEVLGGIGNKKLKKMQSEYERLGAAPSDEGAREDEA